MTSISDIVIGIVIAWFVIRGIERLADLPELLEKWRKSPNTESEDKNQNHT